MDLNILASTQTTQITSQPKQYIGAIDHNVGSTKHLLSDEK